MCYTCDPALVVKEIGFTMVYTRVADPYTQVTDFDYPEGDVEAYEAGDWTYVGLCATLLVNNQPIATETVYGVRETPMMPCAFNNELASAWITEQVLSKHLEIMVQ